MEALENCCHCHKTMDKKQSSDTVSDFRSDTVSGFRSDNRWTLCRTSGRTIVGHCVRFQVDFKSDNGRTLCRTSNRLQVRQSLDTLSDFKSTSSQTEP